MSVVVDNVLQNTVKVVDDASQKYDRIGVAVDRMAARIEGAGKKAERASKQVGGLTAKDILGAREDRIAQAFKTQQAPLLGALDTIQSKGGEAAFERLTARAALLRIQLQKLGTGDIEGLAKMRIRVTDLAAAFDKINGKAKDSTSRLGAFADAFREKFGDGALAGLIGGGIAGVIGALPGMIEGAIGAVTRLYATVRDKAMETRSLANESLQNGLSTRSLQTFDFAAKRLGIDVGTLRNGMEILAQKVVEQPAAFEKLGIKVRDASGHFLKLDDVLLNLSDYFGNIHDQTYKLALVQELVGQRIGGRILPMLALGRKGWQDLAAEGESYGYVLDKLSQKQLIATANSMALVEARLTGMRNNLIVSATPAIDFYIGKVEEAVASLSAWASAANSINWVAQWTLGKIGIGPGKKAKPGAADTADSTGDADTQDTMTTAQMEQTLRGFRNQARTGQAFNAIEDLMDSIQRGGPTSKKTLDEIALRFDTTSLSAEKLRVVVKTLVDTIGGDNTRRVIERAPLVQAMAERFGSMWRAIENMVGSKATSDDPAERVNQMAKAFDGLVRGQSAAEQSVDDLADRWDRFFGDETLTRRANSFVKFSDRAIASAKALRDSLGEDSKDIEVTLTPKVPEHSLASIAAQFKAAFSLDDDTFANVIKRVGEKADAKLKELRERMKKDASEFEIGGGAYAVPEIKVEDNDAVKRMSEKMQKNLDKIGKRDDTFKKIKDGLRESASAWDAYYEGVTQVFSKISGRVDDFFAKFLDRVFATKTAWGFVWRVMTEEALHQLNKILLSKLFLLIVHVIEKLVSGGIAPIDSPVGVPADPTGGLAALAPARGEAAAAAISNVTNNYITVPSFSPMDVVRQYTSPRGSLRRANTHLSTVGA